ncbi:hypothetical protein [Brevibacillus choshinensis]|uniref:Uncharacterized protein n=1 Tax=Brevibacillus choshinensis TaxID=54911 RepID=A0ABX7FQN0_BRECH|nr:hypothetical protein [Brevibacillus choshinensis]QRG68554.1 hypothetical protein JNE38_05210 [Brevibacillus choshinensis]
MGDIITSCLVVVLAFILKLVIDRTSDHENVGIALLEFPVDLLFANFAFLSTYIALANKASLAKLSSGEIKELPFLATMQGGVALLVVYIILIVIVIICWRRSERLLLQKKIVRSFLLTLFSYFLTITGVVKLIQMISEVNN